MMLFGYNGKKREREVEERLINSFELIRRKRRSKNGTADSQNPSEFDVTTMCLNSIKDEVTSLQVAVYEFQGSHETKEFKTLEGECSRLISDLDMLKVAGRDDIRMNRRELLILVEQAGDNLAKKAYSNEQNG